MYGYIYKHISKLPDSLTVVDFCTEIVFSAMNETLLRLKKKYKKISTETRTDKTVYLYNLSHNRNGQPTHCSGKNRPIVSKLWEEQINHNHMCRKLEVE